MLIPCLCALKLQLDVYKPVVKYVYELLHNKTKGRRYRVSNAICSGKDGNCWKVNCSDDDDCWTISITGHSLGGGIATIVGSTLGIKVDYAIMWIVLLY